MPGGRWQVAGEIVARNVPVVSIRRGSLELAPRDAVWCRTLIPIVEDLGLRLARQFPELGVRKIMVVAPGNETITVVLPREAAGEAAGEEARSPRPLAAEAPAQAPTETVDLDAHLRAVRRGYLERAANRSAGVKIRNGS